MYYSNYSDEFSQNSYLKVELRNGLTGQNYSYQYNWGNSWDDNYGSLCTPPTPSVPSVPSVPSLYDECYYY